MTELGLDEQTFFYGVSGTGMRLPPREAKSELGRVGTRSQNTIQVFYSAILIFTLHSGIWARDNSHSIRPDPLRGNSLILFGFSQGDRAAPRDERDRLVASKAKLSTSTSSFTCE